MSLPETDRYFEMSEEELRENMEGLLDALEGSTDRLVEGCPEDIPRLMERIDETDAAEFANEEPETAERLQNFLWELAGELVDSDEELRENITSSAVVNFEAEDSPMEGHLHVDGDEKTVRGSSGHVDGAELHISADSNTLVGMVTGSTDLVQGFMAGEFEMDGDIDKGMELASVMEPVYDELSGGRAA